MDYKALSRELSHKVISSAYLFIVADSYIAASYINLIRDMLIPAAVMPLNYTSFGGKTIDIAQLAEALVTMPVAAEKKLVTVKIHTLGENEALTECLLKYLQDPCPTTVLIVAAESCKKNGKLYKCMAASYKTVEFTKLSARDAESWAQDKFAKAGYVIKADALRALTEAVDYNGRTSEEDIGVLANEINKITALAGKKKEITVDTVKKAVAANIHEDTFRYCDALIKGDAADAFRQLDRLFYAKLKAPQIIAAAASTVRDRSNFLYMRHSGLSEAEIVTKTKGHPYRVSRLLTMKGLDENKCLPALKELFDADLAVKTGQLDEKNALYAMTRRICEL